LHELQATLDMNQAPAAPNAEQWMSEMEQSPESMEEAAVSPGDEAQEPSAAAEVDAATAPAPDDGEVTEPLDTSEHVNTSKTAEEAESKASGVSDEAVEPQASEKQEDKP
jgi:hypothetical protein